MADIFVYGTIGTDWWTGERSDETLAKQIADAEEGEDLHVYINSGGGDMFQGLAMMQSLKRYSGKTIAHVDGLAASAATLVALGADEVHMPAGAWMMIHNPWTLAAGDYEDLKRAAEDLEKFAADMARVYSKKTGKDEEELKAAMSRETWLSAEEAVEWGFADYVEEGGDEEDMALAFASLDLSEYEETPDEVRRWADKGRKVAASIASGKPPRDVLRGHSSIVRIKVTADTSAASAQIAQLNDQTAAIAQLTSPKGRTQKEPDMAEEKKTQEPVVAPQSGMNARDILARCESAGLSAEKSLEIVKSCEGKPVVDVQEQIIASLRERTGGQEISGVSVGVDSRDKFKAEMKEGLEMSSGAKPNDRTNRFAGMTLMRMAEECVRATGGKPELSDPHRLFRQASNVQSSLGSNSTSDFPEILRDTVNGIVLRSYQEANATWREWCVTQSLNNFNTHFMLNLNAFDNLTKVEEGGEYTFGTVGERGEQIKLGKYGRIFRLTYEAFVNDDRNIFSSVPAKMGQAAARVPQELAYGILTGNAALSDGENLFSAAHSNTHADALGYAGIDTLRVAMSRQVFPVDGQDVKLNIQAAVIVVPPELEVTAMQIVGSNVVGDNMQVNTFQGRYRVVSDPRLTGTTWYLIADPALVDTVAVGFLNGVEAPFMDEEEEFKTDSLNWKVRLDCAAASMGFRGLQRGGDGS